MFRDLRLSSQIMSQGHHESSPRTLGSHCTSANGNDDRCSSVTEDHAGLDRATQIGARHRRRRQGSIYGGEDGVLPWPASALASCVGVPPAGCRGPMMDGGASAS